MADRGMSVTPGSMALVAALAGAVAWIVVGLIARLARRQGWLDLPNDRSLHTNPTPRLGGIGLIAAMLTAPGFAALFSLTMAFPLPLLLVGTGVGAISLIDDLRGLPAVFRFTVHVASAVLAVLLLGPVDALTLTRGWEVALGWAAAPLTVIAIVGFVNAFNFMDGIDGLAGGQALVAGLGWTAVGWLTGQIVPAVVGATLAAASLGFLWHNWSPARIFMGDVGSAFLGFVLSTLPLLATPAHDYVVPAVLLVWPFVFDTAFTLGRRLMRGENVFAAHRTHLYQRLTQSGWSHARVARLYMALAAAGAALAVAVATGVLPPFGGLAWICAGSVALWLFVTAMERRARGSQQP